MPAPAYVAPLVQGGMSIGGNLFSAREGKKARRFQRKEADRLGNIEYARQKEFAQMGIRWKVEDAKAAGLHPLYALGAMPANYSPAQIQSVGGGSSGIGESMAEAGQSISRAMMATQTNDEKRMAQMAMEAHIANMAESDMRRQVLESERDRNYQEMMRGITADIPSVTPMYEMGQSPALLPDQAPAGFVPHNVISPKGPTVYSSPVGDPSTGDGATPMWRRFTVGHGREMVLPGGMGGDAAEVLESLAESPMMMAAVVAENESRYGKNNAFRLMWERKGEPWWRIPGSWLGGKLADARDSLRRAKFGTKGDYRSYAKGARWRNGKIEYYWR